MTFAQKYIQQHPEDDIMEIESSYCPKFFGYKLDVPDKCISQAGAFHCYECWNREIPTSTPTNATEQQVSSPIPDSGSRTVFDSGAVRDIQEGKGRCDLLPLDIVAEWLNGDEVIKNIAAFVDNGNVAELFDVLLIFVTEHYPNNSTAILELSKHFEDGAKKYGEHNWKKGIPVCCFINSAVRHYLKFLRSEKDEPHDRAFMWNIICAIWTCEHKPELNEYGRKNTDG